MRVLAVSHAAILSINRPFWTELARRGHRVCLVVPTRWRNDYGSRPLRPEPLADSAGGLLSLQPCRAAMPGSTALQCYTPMAVARLAAWRPDIIFIDEEPWSLATLQWTALAAALRRPVALRTEENRRRTFPWPFSLLHKTVLARAAGIAAVSEMGAQVLRDHGYGGVTAVLPHAVDTQLFYPNPPDQRPGGALPRIGFVGRIVPPKGLETLLDAAALLTERSGRSAVTFALYGAGEPAYLEGLRDRQRHLGLGNDTIMWHGPVAHHDVPQAMQSLDLLVVPTVSHRGYKEQFGRVVIEALACKVPVLTSDNGELPVLVARTGGGFVTPEGQPRALAEQITAALADRSALAARAEAGYQYVLRHYTYGTLAQEVEGFLRRLVGDAAATTQE